MRVVQVSAYRDYEGCQWSGLFSTPELAYSWLRSVNADTFAGVDDVSVCWIGVDGDTEFQRLSDFSVKFKWGTGPEEDSVTLSKWDPEKKEYVEVDLENE